MNILNAILVMLALVGSYAIKGSFFDVLLTLFFGLIGFVMTRGGFPMAPIVLGLIHGSMFDGEFRRAIKLGNGSASIFLHRPVAMFFILVAVAVIVSTVISRARKAKKGDEE